MSRPSSEKGLPILLSQASDLHFGFEDSNDTLCNLVKRARERRAILDEFRISYAGISLPANVKGASDLFSLRLVKVEDPVYAGVQECPRSLSEFGPDLAEPRLKRQSKRKRKLSEPAAQLKPFNPRSPESFEHVTELPQLPKKSAQQTGLGKKNPLSASLSFFPRVSPLTRAVSNQQIRRGSMPKTQGGAGQVSFTQEHIGIWKIQKLEIILVSKDVYQPVSVTITRPILHPLMVASTFSQTKNRLGFLPRLGAGLGTSSNLKKVFPEDASISSNLNLTNGKLSLPSSPNQTRSLSISESDAGGSVGGISPTELTSNQTAADDHDLRTNSLIVSAEEDILGAKSMQISASIPVSKNSTIAQTPSQRGLRYTTKRLRKEIKTIISNMFSHHGSRSHGGNWIERLKHDKVEWGFINVLAGFLQSIILGGLEGYLSWRIWKFYTTCWGDHAGNFPFIQVHLALFIAGQFALAFGFMDAAVNKNSLQVLTFILFNAGLFAYTFVQKGRILSLQTCGNTFLDVYTKDPSPTIYTDVGNRITPFQASSTTLTALFLSSRDGSVTFDLMGDCPWTFKKGALEALRENNYLLTDMDSLLNAIMATCAIGVMASIVLGSKALSEYKWKIFELQGASLRRRYMILRYHLFIVLLKMNLFLKLSIVTMMISASYFSSEALADKQRALSQKYYFYSSQTQEFLIPESMVPSVENVPPLSTTLVPAAVITAFISSVFFALGWYGIRKTNLVAMSFFFVLIVGDIAADMYLVTLVQSSSLYSYTRENLLVFTALQIILDVVAFVTGAMSIRDFNQGLRIMLDAQRVLATSDPELFQRPKSRTRPILD
ncbi:hypothetical protein CcCBS67573_g00447 [Chytriomyces confervae]|uniref:Uncharacterized protein n=1 Tax=Chytriomyces confervae TaxID=246404 RepID=A0A507FU59_9FUNG|nr:hypothetical protein CcCBS67573_g00447 [Chytriomyces confervae]